MTKRTAVIIEDEIPAARLLHAMLLRLRPDWDIQMVPGSIEEAARWFREHMHPDLLFLDIQLADGNSFELLSEAKPNSTIIFTTAYDEYAIRAFSVNSIDYILKPIDEQRLREAIEKYEAFAQVPTTQMQSVEQLDLILDSLRCREKRYRTRFLISGADRFWTLPVADVAYFYSENKITFAVAHTGREYVVDFPLSKLVEQLNPDSFFRANRQVLLSVECIDHIEPYFQAKVVVSVKPAFKGKILISEEKITTFKRWLNF